MLQDKRIDADYSSSLIGELSAVIIRIRFIKAISNLYGTCVWKYALIDNTLPRCFNKIGSSHVTLNKIPVQQQNQSFLGFASESPASGIQSVSNYVLQFAQAITTVTLIKLGEKGSVDRRVVHGDETSTMRHVAQCRMNQVSY